MVLHDLNGNPVTPSVARMLLEHGIDPRQVTDSDSTAAKIVISDMVPATALFPGADDPQSAVKDWILSDV